MGNMHCFQGKLHRCSNGVFLSALGAAAPGDSDFVDIGNDLVSLAEKRRVIANFYNHPTAVCRICRNAQTGRGGARRYQAAEQIKR
jgi:hypothetical protein